MLLILLTPLIRRAKMTGKSLARSWVERQGQHRFKQVTFASLKTLVQVSFMHHPPFYQMGFQMTLL